MSPGTNSVRAPRSVRKLAEKRLADRPPADLDRLTRDEIRGLIHELEVHRIELEIQNQHLAEAQLSAEESQEGYRQLYEAAPIGYLTLDADGVIVSANPCAAELLRLSRAKLMRRKLTGFIAVRDQDRWHFARIARAQEPRRHKLQLELELELGDGTTLEVQLLGTGRSDASGAIDLALLDVTELRKTERALRKAAAHASLAEQRERRSLAEDLHDDVGQLLSLASLKLRAFAHAKADEQPAQLQALTELIADARNRITTLSFQLSPPLLHDVGLLAATRWLAEDLLQRYGLTVTIVETEELALDELTRVKLFRAIRELLINVTKHAGVDRAKVRVWVKGGIVRAEVEDGGGGFDPDFSHPGFGLLALRERFAQLGGSVVIESRVAGGTRVVVSLPSQTRAGDPR